MKVTPYEDINNLLEDLVADVQRVLKDNLVGIYLFGSLSYNDFNSERSDLDIVVVIQHQLPQQELEAVKKLHQDIEDKHVKWAKRIEVSYVPKNMLTNILPPEEPRPYLGEGKFYPQAKYGNEWIINNYLLYKHGITLVGPDFKTLIKPIEIKDVQEAAKKDLFKEWQPKLSDDNYLANSHYQSYVVLNLCRILYTIMQVDLASKKVSCVWVKNEYPQWKDLIEEAENWKYGVEMNRPEETKKFIQFVIDKVKTNSTNGETTNL